MKATRLGFGGLLSCLLLNFIFQPDSNAQPVVSISGPGQAYVVIYNGQAFATSWAQTNPATNVTVTVGLSSWGMPGQTGRAYLTTQLGPGTTTAHEIASATFEFPLEAGDVTLFSGLTLEPGRYYLSMVGDGDWGSGWLSGCGANVSFADGVTLGPDYGFFGVGAYLPATGASEQPVIFMRFNVVSMTDPPAPPNVASNDVDEPNNPPMVINQSITVVQDTAHVFSLQAVDPDGDPLGVFPLSSPTHGVLSNRVFGRITDTCFPLAELIYTPEPGFVGTDLFEYFVSDGSAGAMGAVTIMVVPPIPPNHPPEATPQSVVTEFETAVEITVGGSDPDGDALTHTVVAGPAHGTLSGSPGALNYTPATGFSGSDSFTFTASDGVLVSAPATVSIIVSPSDAPPFAPVNLVASAPSDHQVVLSWTDRSTREKGFRIERAVDGVNFKQIASLAANVTSYSDSGVQHGKTYTYRVRAYNKYGNSAYSNLAVVTP